MNPEIWRYIFDAIEDPVFLHDAQYRVLLANRAYCRAAGVAEAEALNKPYWEVFPLGSGPLPGCQNTLDHGHAGNQEEVVAGDRHFISKGYAVRDDQGNLLYSLHLLSDITERRGLQRSKATLDEAQRIAHLGSWEWDILADKITWSDENYRIFGYTPESIPATYEAVLSSIHAEDRERVAAAVKATLEEGVPFDFEYRAVRPDGAIRTVHARGEAFSDANGRVTRMIGTVLDVTDLRQAQDHLARLNRMYRTISLCNQALVRSRDELELSREMCRVLVEEGGFRSAWVGYAEQGVGKRIQPVATAGIEQSEIEGMNLTWEDKERRNGPIGTAVRTGNFVASRDILNDPLWTPWHEQAMRQGYAAAVTFPLQINGQTLGVLNIYSAEPDVFAQDMLELLAELAGDLAFGIGNFRARAERLDILEKHGQSLNHAVTAIAATVEIRDPYTAGHQRRVARLATAIAAEMGMDEDRLEGLRMAGVVHDIGKIHVPAEILSNPSKLTDAEFEIIKTHPLAGYEILKGIDFPWPVAEIVWQHHEKLDGSGYPRGLKGEEILLEARILTVADVVEAMASNRPYRPGFGVFPALQEISRQKGKLYDVGAVEACLRIFMARNYEL
ncbi:MAG: HD domain-containing phosphohydrolase [Sulfuricella sp.]